MVAAGAANLALHRAEVNDLNVFPVPDGDTGDNMYLTISSGAESGEGDEVDRMSRAVSGGMLTGARGNSGVILSRIFSGIASGLEGLKKADVREFCTAMRRGIDEAYGAVSHPVEGTILTVYREAVNTAAAGLDPTGSFEDFFTDLLRETRLSLERTPDQLDVLREAGVVDSGGAGLMYITEGILDALNGKEVFSDPSSRPSSGKTVPDLSLFDEHSALDFGYCTEFLLRLQAAKVDLSSFDEKVIRDFLCEKGESVVFFRDGTIVKAHVHTFRPGEILNECQKYGEFLTLKIENMALQHNENEPEKASLRRKVRKKYGTVAVACGEGVKKMFSSLGVDEIVDGGQSMNPSSGDFLKAFDGVNADTVFVFPNNSNVILAAEQAAGMCGSSEIRVIRTKTIGEGYAALSMLSFDGTVDDIVSSIEASYEGVLTGTVSTASRNADWNGVTVKKGEYIGFCDKTILSASSGREETALGLAEKLGAKDGDVVILLRGAGVPEEEGEKLRRALSASCPRTEVILTDGGQPVYDYIMIVE